MKSPSLQNPLEAFLKLNGHFHDSQKIPDHCPECQCKDFYKQSDFKKSIGLSLVSIASVGTMILMAMGYNWFVIWSPMFVVLIFDRVMFRLRPEVAICYKCKHIVRGIPADTLEELDTFDLELYDRYKYKEENASNP